MAQPTISFNRGQGGLGRPLATNDHISGFIMPFVNANLPAGFSTTNRIKIVYSISEAKTLGITQAGTYTKLLWYHLNQFFKRQPLGKLYIHLIDSTAVTFAEVETLQNFSGGEIRQIGFYNVLSAFSTANLTTIQSSCTTLEGINKPVQVLYACNFQAIATIGALADLRALSCKNVSVVIGEDGDNLGSALAISETKSVTCIGSALGVLSASKVNENLGWIEKFNVVENGEFNEPALAITSATFLVKNQSQSALDGVNDKGYIFLNKQVGIDGTYFNDSPTAISETSDYAYIENNRTIDKAIRNVRVFLLPSLNSPLYVNQDGTLSEDVISKFKNDCERALERMDIDGEISDYKVIINPLQDVLTTSKLSIAIKIVPVGVAREIEINIGFAVNV
jgi:hypothetical protein